MQDVTTWLKQSAAELPSGKLIRPAELTLLDAMNSMQIMEPKMDTGMMKPSMPCFDPLTPLWPEEVCWVMDEMMAMKIAWYSGSPLCQTIFTSLYYFNPHHMYPLAESSSQAPFMELISLVLRSFALVYGKTIEFAYKELSKGNVNDGEDCWLDHYGLPVPMMDSVDDIVDLVDQALEWLNEYDDIWFRELEYRLEICRGFLMYLDSNSRPVEERDFGLEYLLKLSELIRHPGTPRLIVRSAFDNGMSARLRQTMPLPPVGRISQAEVWVEMRRILSDIVLLEALIDGQHTGPWELSLQSLSWGAPSPIIRSLYKSALVSTPGRRSAVTEPASLASRWLSEQIGLADDTMSQLETVLTDPKQKRQFAIWRDLFGGYMFRTFAVPLQNRARQRRDYLSLSYAWHERAVTVEQVFQYQTFRTIAPALHAARLDCLLQAALAAFDLALISPAEEQEAWWWIHSVSAARSDLQLQETWRSEWAKSWSSVGAGMLSVAGVPRTTSLPSSTRERFNLRHKWARKIPTLSDGTKYRSGFRPQYTVWRKARKELRTLEASEALQLGVTQLRQAEVSLDKLSRLLSASDFAEDFQTTVQSIRDDIHANVRIVDKGKPMCWETKRRKWIPRLAD